MTARAHSTRDREQGVVLLLAVIVLTGVIALSMSMLEVHTAHDKQLALDIERERGRWLAEGGIAVAHQRLILSPTFTGTIEDSFGADTYEVTVTRVGQTVDVISIAELSSLVAGYQSRVVATGPVIDVTHTLFAGGDVSTSAGSTITWGGPFAAVGTVSTDAGSAGIGRLSRISPQPPLVIDTSAFESTASTVLDAGTSIPGGSSLGSIAARGAMIVTGTAALVGTLTTAGDLTIDGSGGDVLISSDGSSTALAVDGNLIVENVDQLEIVGTIFCTGNVTFRNIANLEALGSLICQGDLTFEEVTATWEFDPAILDAPPDFVSGIRERFTGEEIWRRPYLPAEN